MTTNEYEDGYASQRDSVERSKNPYPDEGNQRDDWFAGWDNAFSEWS